MAEDLFDGEQVVFEMSVAAAHKKLAQLLDQVRMLEEKQARLEEEQSWILSRLKRLERKSS